MVVATALTTLQQTRQAQDAAAAAQQQSIQQALLIKQAQCVQKSNHIEDLSKKVFLQNLMSNGTIESITLRSIPH